VGAVARPRFGLAQLQGGILFSLVQLALGAKLGEDFVRLIEPLLAAPQLPCLFQRHLQYEQARCVSLSAKCFGQIVDCVADSFLAFNVALARVVRFVVVVVFHFRFFFVVVSLGVNPANTPKMGDSPLSVNN